jgi:hypothetical protein
VDGNQSCRANAGAGNNYTTTTGRLNVSCSVLVTIRGAIRASTTSTLSGDYTINPDTSRDPALTVTMVISALTGVPDTIVFTAMPPERRSVIFTANAATTPSGFEFTGRTRDDYTITYRNVTPRNRPCNVALRAGESCEAPIDSTRFTGTFRCTLDIQDANRNVLGSVPVEG